MSKESITNKIDSVEAYDSAVNFFKFLTKLSIKAALSARQDFVYEWHSEFYCGNCDNLLDDNSSCNCYDDDHPRYSIFDDEASFE